MQKRDFRWNAYANVTYNQNRVVKLATDDPIETDFQIIEEGRPYRQFYMKEYAGVDYDTGKPLWYLNESGDETTGDYNAAAKRYVGSADPKVLGGFGTSVNWKGLDFNIDFTYRLGGKVYNYGAPFTGYGMSLMSPLREVAVDSWTEDNKGAKHPQYIPGDPYNATKDSSRFLYSGQLSENRKYHAGLYAAREVDQKGFHSEVACLRVARQRLYGHGRRFRGLHSRNVYFGHYGLAVACQPHLYGRYSAYFLTYAV